MRKINQEDETEEDKECCSNEGNVITPEHKKFVGNEERGDDK